MIKSKSKALELTVLMIAKSFQAHAELGLRKARKQNNDDQQLLLFPPASK